MATIDPLTTSPKGSKNKKREARKAVLTWLLHNFLYIIATILIIGSILIKGSLVYFVFISHRTEVMKVIVQMEKIDEQKGDEGLNTKIRTFNN